MLYIISTVTKMKTHKENEKGIKTGYYKNINYIKKKIKMDKMRNQKL